MLKNVKNKLYKTLFSIFDNIETNSNPIGVKSLMPADSLIIQWSQDMWNLVYFTQASSIYK